jgi:hypothetical protein
MSDTYKHKGKGYWNNGITSKPEVEIYLKYCRRHNKEKSYCKQNEISLREKADKALMAKDILEVIEEK